MRLSVIFDLYLLYLTFNSVTSVILNKFGIFLAFFLMLFPDAYELRVKSFPNALERGADLCYNTKNNCAILRALPRFWEEPP